MGTSNAFSPAATDKWTVFFSECGLLGVQAAMIEHNAEHDTCKREAIRQSREVANVTIGDKVVDCGQRADPFTWAVEGTVSVSARQPSGEYLPAGDVPRLFLRPGLLAVEVAVIALLGVRTLSMRAGHSTVLQRTVLALLVARVTFSMLQLAALRAMALGATYADRAAVFFPLLRASNGLATGIVVVVGLLTSSGWQTLFTSLPQSGARLGIVTTALAVIGVVIPATAMLPSAPPLPSNLAPLRPATAASDDSSNGARGSAGTEVPAWIAATAIAGAASVVVAAFTVRYVATMAVATVSFRLSNARRGPQLPRFTRIVQILQIQETMLLGARRDLLLLQLVWLATFALSGPINGSPTLAWVGDLVQEGAALSFLAITAYRFRPRHRGPGSAQVAPTGQGEGAEPNACEPVTDPEAAAEARRFLIIRGVDGPDGPSDLAAASLADVIARITGRNSPPLDGAASGSLHLPTEKRPAHPFVLVLRPAASRCATSTADTSSDGEGVDTSDPPVSGKRPRAVALGCLPAVLPWTDTRGRKEQRRPAPRRGRVGHRLSRLAAEQRRIPADL